MHWVHRVVLLIVSKKGLRLLIVEFIPIILVRNLVVLYTGASILFNDAVVDIPSHVRDLGIQ